MVLGIGQCPKIEFHSEVAFHRLAPVLENAIYRIVQEGLTNACKYSKSTRVQISLLQREDRLCITIQDWGIGFAPEDRRQGTFWLGRDSAAGQVARRH